MGPKRGISTQQQSSTFGRKKDKTESHPGPLAIMSYERVEIVVRNYLLKSLYFLHYSLGFSIPPVLG